MVVDKACLVLCHNVLVHPHVGDSLTVSGRGGHATALPTAISSLLPELVEEREGEALRLTLRCSKDSERIGVSQLARAFLGSWSEGNESHRRDFAGVLRHGG